jgi:hypothetical protein
MKRLIFISLALVFIMSVDSLAEYEYPIDQGNLIIGGTAGYNNYYASYGNNHVGVLTLNPEILYFIVPAFGMGVDVYYESQYNKGNSSHWLTIGPKIAYYFGSQGSKTLPFVEFSLTLGSGSNNSSSTGIQFGGGLAYIFVEHIAVTGKASFRTAGSGGSNYYSFSNSIGINLGFSMFIY